MLIPSTIGLICMLSHEWWRDEAHTWLVVSTSGTLSELVQNLGFNGHPRLYYVLAWALHGVWNNPLIMSLANLAFSLAAGFMFLRSAPVTRLQAALFSLGFFPLYQYGVISRSYSFFIFLLFLYCHLRSSRPEAIVLRLLVLALLAQIHLISLMAAGALLVHDWATTVRWKAPAWMMVAVVLLSMAASAWQMSPGDKSAPQLGRTEMTELRGGVSDAFVPNFGVLDIDGALHYVQRGLGLILALASVALLWPKRSALLAYLMLAGGLVAICAIVYSGYRWHHGFYFIFMLVGLWLGGRPGVAGARAYFLTFVLGIHAIVGIYAVGEDVALPYSNGRLAARHLIKERMESLPLVGMLVLDDTQPVRYQWEVDAIQPVMVELGGKKIYDPVTGRYESFFTHYGVLDFYPIMSKAEAENGLRAVSGHLGGRFVVVAFRPPPMMMPTRGHQRTESEMPASLRKLTDLPAPFDFGEEYSLYLYSPEPALPKGF
jgi:hypothetical protein